GGSMANGMFEFDTVGDNKILVIKSDHVRLENIYFDTAQFGFIEMEFNGFDTGMSLNDYITYRVIVRDALTDSLIGGNTWHVYRENRPTGMRGVNAGIDRSVFENEYLTLSGSVFNTSATYQWLNSKGQIMHEGREWSIDKPQAGAYIYV